MDSVTDLTHEPGHTQHKQNPRTTFLATIKLLCQPQIGNQSLFLAFSIIFVLTMTARASSREKIDIVYMQNGDKITCEIRSLEQGQLTIKPDYTNSTVVIDWKKVDHVESSQSFLVSEPDGTLHTGSLSSNTEERSLVVEHTPPVTLPYDKVIEIEPLGTSFFKRLRGNYDMGLSLARSNSQKNLTVQGALTYQSQKYLFSSSSSSQFTSQAKTDNTEEASLKTSLFRQLRRSNWYGGGIANFLSSSEQQVNLRSTFGVALAKRLIFTNRSDLTAIGGLAYTLEQDQAGTTSNAHPNELDSAFAVQYSTFRFDSTTFDTSVWVYPSLVAAGRVRMTLNQDIYYKFLGDFYIRFSFYDNYDNQPVIKAPVNNLGGSTTIGWSFH
jgi:Protein of unknown function, DUF481